MTHLVPLDGVSGRRVGLAAGGRRYGVPETEFTGRCQARIVGPRLGGCGEESETGTENYQEQGI